MCIILDNNVVSRILLDSSDSFFDILHHDIFNKSKLTIVYGGKLRDEYELNFKIKKIILALDRAGKARQVERNIIDAEVENIISICESDDSHVIALARASKTRLLCTEDKDLQKDFHNKTLIDKPRGKIYTKKAHKYLIDMFCN